MTGVFEFGYSLLTEFLKFTDSCVFIITLSDDALLGFYLILLGLGAMKLKTTQRHWTGNSLVADDYL